MTLLADTAVAVAEPWVLGELKSVISLLRLTDWQSDNIPAYSQNGSGYFNISKLDLYTSEHFVNIFINNLRQGSYSVLPRDGRYVTRAGVLGYDTWHLLLSCSPLCSNFLHHTPMPVSSCDCGVKHKYFPQHDSYFPTSCWPLHWHRKSTQTIPLQTNSPF